MSGGDCGFCHIQPGTFLKPGFRTEQEFCYSCHNTAGVAHETVIGGNRDHSTIINVTSGNANMPTYGNITAGERNNQPFSRLKDGGKVVCVTCHNAMSKVEDYGRVWERAISMDNIKYTLVRGGWADCGWLVPVVYRTSTFIATPTYSKARKSYLVDPTEYTYDETTGKFKFRTAQASGTYIYVTLDFPFLRASQEGNRLCGDCHTQATHKGSNCLACHQAHNTTNIEGVRGKVRTPAPSEKSVIFARHTGANSFADGDATRDGICEVCHTKTKYYRNNTTAFANHSGGFNYSGKDCTSCHSHARGFAR